MKVGDPITWWSDLHHRAVHGTVLRVNVATFHGLIDWQPLNHHVTHYNNPLFAGEENYRWIKGHHEDGSEAVLALRATAALTTR